MTSKTLANYFLKRLMQFDTTKLFEELCEYNQGAKHALQYLALHEKEDVTAGNIADTLAISTARATKVINNLVKNGYVTKCDSDKDARVTLVKITDIGKKYIDKEREVILNKMELVIDEVGVDDLMEFIRVSKKIKKAIKGECID